MNTKNLKISIIVFLILFSVFSCINPVFPNEQILQHIGTVLLLMLLIPDLKQGKLSITSFLCIASYIFIHIIGARYIYSYVPYNEWINTAFNIDINTFFNTSRNHYDRFVHLASGILAFPYLYEIFGRKIKTKKSIMILTVWAFIQTIGMLYELFEWLLTLVMSEEAANNYNGQQGDMWDAQKDMALALLGSTIMAFFYLLKREKNKNNKES